MISGVLSEELPWCWARRFLCEGENLNIVEFNIRKQERWLWTQTRCVCRKISLPPALLESPLHDTLCNTFSSFVEAPLKILFCNILFYSFILWKKLGGNNFRHVERSHEFCKGFLYCKKKILQRIPIYPSPRFSTC